MMAIHEILSSFPFIAITRGVEPHEAEAVGAAICSGGFRVIENPLNSPDPCRSIEIMGRVLASRALIGAGTVTTVDQVDMVKKAGGSLIISPHCDPAIIRATKEAGLISIPGVATPTEAMTALAAGADALKLFPAEIITAQAVGAFRVVLPPETVLLVVGGITPNNWQPYLQKGASGFAVGSSLYAPGRSIGDITARAAAFVNAWQVHTG
jgi:2-dehydro-3-deoxyphosphogalactonate aldolase